MPPDQFIRHFQGDLQQLKERLLLMAGFAEERVSLALKALVERPLSITDLFRRPTVRALAAFLSGEEDDGGVAERSEGRAAARRAAMERRRSRRRGPRGD